MKSMEAKMSNNPVEFWNDSIRDIAKTLKPDQARILAETFGRIWNERTQMKKRAEEAEARAEAEQARSQALHNKLKNILTELTR